MPRFAANLTMMYNEHPFLERFAAAAADGFKGVEVLFPYAVPAAELRARLDEYELEQALFNLPPGDWEAGERGLASIPGREDDFRHALEMGLSYALVLGNERLHVMAGRVPDGGDRARHRDVYLSNLALAAREAATLGITVVIEPLNPRDAPGYFLTRQDEAHAVCAAVGAANLKVQMDFYHCQIVEGDLAVKLRAYVQNVGHIQIAGVPDRHEPDEGEINYPYLFALIDTLGYEGWVGCEYRPRAGTSEGLGWLTRWRDSTPTPQ